MVRGDRVKMELRRVAVCLIILAAAVCPARSYNQGPLPVIQEQAPPVQHPIPTLPPCRPKSTVTVTDLRQHMLMSSTKVKVNSNDIIGRKYDWKSDVNCTEEDGTSVEPVEYDHWKLHIIMGCTVTAAIEFVLIIFIILYWKQIRWTLRKITCPCDRCRQHEAMEAGDPEEADTSDVDIVEMGLSTREGRGRSPRADRIMRDPMIQTFSAPWNSRVQSGDEGVDDVAIPGPSGLSVTAVTRSNPLMSLDRQYSSSDESLSGAICQQGPPQAASTPSKSIQVKNRVKSSRRPGSVSKLHHDSVMDGQDKPGGDMSGGDMSGGDMCGGEDRQYHQPNTSAEPMSIHCDTSDTMTHSCQLNNDTEPDVSLHNHLSVSGNDHQCPDISPAVLEPTNDISCELSLVSGERSSDLTNQRPTSLLSSEDADANLVLTVADVHYQLTNDTTS